MYHTTLKGSMTKSTSQPEGYAVRKFIGTTKRYVQTLSLKEDAQFIRQYCLAHSKEEHWREIREGIRAVGILEMEIYIHDTQLTMIVETPSDLNWTQAMQQLSTMPRQAEWEAFVAKFQQCDANARSDEKWKMMNRIFYLYD